MSENEPAASGPSLERTTQTRREQGLERPQDDSTANQEKSTAGHSSVGVTYYLEQTLATEPPEADATLRQIATVAWVSYERRSDPAEVWPEVLGRCPRCGLKPEPSGAGLACPHCDLTLAGGCFQ